MDPVKLFSTNVPILYPLKTSENYRFSDVFRGYGIGTLDENGLNNDGERCHHQFDHVTNFYYCQELTRNLLNLPEL